MTAAACRLLKLACADVAHTLMRPCRRGRSRKLPARGLRMLLLKLALTLGAAIALFALLPMKVEAPGGSFSEALQNPGVEAPLETDQPKELEDERIDERIERIEKMQKGEDQQIKVESTAPADSTDQQTTKIQPTAATAPKQKSEKSPEPSKPPKNKSKDKASTKAEDKAASKPKDHEFPGPVSDDIHVCFCSDDTDWRPLAAAINSTLQNAKRPQLITFHLITSPELAPVVGSVLVKVLGPALEAQLKVHSSAALQNRIKSQISYRKSSSARKGLASPFNFAPFYLEDFISQSNDLPQRLIYLDTDVLLMGDIEVLWKTDMKGSPAAAVEDCSQSFELYIDFAELEELGLKSSSLSPKECVFNRGIFLMDVAQWKRLHITQDIEKWMGKYRESKKDIYKFGMSQPPWLLALHKKYRKLGPAPGQCALDVAG